MNVHPRALGYWTCASPVIISDYGGSLMINIIVSANLDWRLRFEFRDIKKMPKLRKCYFGCALADGPLHKFPKWEYPHEERFNAWKSVLDEETKSKGNKYIENSIRLCESHFEQKFKSPSRRLIANAIPTLNLGQQTKDVDQVVIAPPPVSATTNNMCLNNNYSTSNQEPIQMDGSSGIEACSVAEYYNCSAATLSLITDNSQPSPSNQEPIPKDPIPMDVPSKINVCSAATCVPRAAYLRMENELERLKNRVELLRKKCRITKKKLQLAQKVSKNSSLKFIKKLPMPTQVFLNLQLKHKYKPRGRRFNLNEKVMALSIYKESPMAYKILKRMFVLPSKRVMQKMIASFSLIPAIDKDITLS